MRRYEIDVEATSTAPPERVYSLLVDGPTWPEWAAIDALTLERTGDNSPEGVGAIRVLRRGRVTGRDQILELVPNRRLKYASLSGLPVRDYVGQVDLDPRPGRGTTIHWHASFVPDKRGTGRLLRLGIRRFLQRCASGLADYAGARAREMAA